MQDQDPANQRRKIHPRKTSVQEQPSQRSNSRDSRMNSRITVTWRSKGGKLWPRNSDSTSLKSKSGFRTKERRLKKPRGAKTHLHYTWWHKDYTITQHMQRTTNQTAINVKDRTSWNAIILNKGQCTKIPALNEWKLYVWDHMILQYYMYILCVRWCKPFSINITAVHGLKLQIAQGKGRFFI